MLFIALVSVCLGIGVEVPALGIGLAIISTPALIRAAVVTSRREAKGIPVSMGGKVLAFLGSLGVVTVTGVASAAAFSAVCFGSAFLGQAAGSAQHGNESGLGGLILGAMIGGGIGLIIGIYVFYRFVRWLWPIKDRS